jgi:hypothetical protein
MYKKRYEYLRDFLFSRMWIYAYVIAGTVTTTLQFLWLPQSVFEMTAWRTETLPMVVEVYIETLFPIWIGGITSLNRTVVAWNLVLAHSLLFMWAISEYRSDNRTQPGSVVRYFSLR